ncbi:MAG: LD-carboxypeptidase [Maledivibacter sp.]|jgi:muramoyltetrapeptide carboxypeptidase|nr:LD-carboxypeptidase [Maledivibacter sp.]
MIKPKALNIGDRVAIIAPSSPTTEENVLKAEKAVKKMGLDPIIYPSCYSYHGHLSGTDIIRAKDINDAFKDPTIMGIICLKGGYGTPRLLNLIDYELIKNNPKYFLGYSDITALHMAFNKICKLVTYHGPMASAGWIKDLDPYTKNYLKLSLFSNEKLNLLKNPSGEDFKTLVPGIAKGKIIGGNLSLLASTLGSPYEIDTKDKILFMEEVGEDNYCIDRMLMSLSLAGKFQDCRGIILGTFTNCKPDLKADSFQDLSLDEIFEEIIVPFNKPTLSNFRAGHNYPQPTFPMGVEVELDADNRNITFLEASNI